MNREAEEARQTALDIEEGKKSIYWVHVEAQIKRWIDAEERILRKYNAMQLDPEKSREILMERNLCVERKMVFEKMLEINEIILDKKLSIIERLSIPVKDTFKYVSTFVGRAKDFAFNGQK